jgi:hypothetical protein
MFQRIMAAALTLGAIGGASLAFAQNHFADPQVGSGASVLSEPEAPVACQPVAFRIYFEPGSSRLNRQAREIVDIASRRVVGCNSVHFQLAADADQIDRPESRRRASERSVSILSAFRSKGILGEVYVAPIDKLANLSGAHAGPDFVEVGIVPMQTPVMLSHNARETEI